jgi:hypothetical protein
MAMAQPTRSAGTPCDLSLSASDVMRLAITRLRDQLPEKELRKALIAHVRSEAEQYPGRARRGLPEG